jgi:hypothetical protein
LAGGWLIPILLFWIAQRGIVIANPALLKTKHQHRGAGVVIHAFLNLVGFGAAVVMAQ